MTQDYKTLAAKMAYAYRKENERNVKERSPAIYSREDLLSTPSYTPNILIIILLATLYYYKHAEYQYCNTHHLD